MDARHFGSTAQLGFQLRTGGSPSRQLIGAVEPLGALPLPEAIARAGARLRDEALPELEKFAGDVARWPELPDFRACAGAGAEAISGPDTDGGFHRALFGQFLEQAGQPRLGHAYRELAWSWRELATAMKLAANDGAWDGMAEHVQRLCERERELAERLVEIGSGRPA